MRNCEHTLAFGRSVTVTSAQTRVSDPNHQPVSAAARKLAEQPGVCAYCGEPADDRSQIESRGMHPECAAAWDAERVTS